MSNLLKVASFEKQAMGLLRGLGRGLDKGVYRPITNAFKAPANKLSASDWARYRAANPVGADAMGLPLAAGAITAPFWAPEAYGGFQKGVEGAKNWWEENVDLTPKFMDPLFRHAGLIGGAALPTLAFIASKGRVKPSIGANAIANVSKQRTYLPWTLATAPSAWAGHAFDQYRAEQKVKNTEREEDLLRRIMDKGDMYKREGVSRNDPRGVMRPDQRHRMHSDQFPVDRSGNPIINF